MEEGIPILGLWLRRIFSVLCPGSPLPTAGCHDVLLAAPLRRILDSRDEGRARTCMKHQHLHIQPFRHSHFFTAMYHSRHGTFQISSHPSSKPKVSIDEGAGSGLRLCRLQTQSVLCDAKNPHCGRHVYLSQCIQDAFALFPLSAFLLTKRICWLLYISFDLKMSGRRCETRCIRVCSPEPPCVKRNHQYT